MELTYSAPGLDRHEIIKTERYWTHTFDVKLLDILSGNTAFIFGYSDPEIFASMSSTQKTVGFLRGVANETSAANDEVINKLCRAGDFASVSWAVSGSDGVELAISANDQYWKTLGVNKPTVVVFDPNYHGTTYLAKIFRGQYTAGNRCVWVSNLDQLQTVLENNAEIGAVLMESCPWVAGIRPWTLHHWITVRNLCSQYVVNFIVDDVFGGVGKLGHVFSHQRYNVKPDIVVLGKALTAGYSPLSCACLNESITTVVRDNWDYGHTWSPNMAGIGAALVVLEKIDGEKIKSIEARLSKIALNLMSATLITKYTNIGLLLELNLNSDYPPNVLIKHGLNGTISDLNTIKICAPIIADEEYFNWLESNLSLALSCK